MKSWIDGIITVAAKSGRVSRSRNCAIEACWAMNSPAFCWIGFRPARSALELAQIRGYPASFAAAAASGDPR
jgi:hypothetical protein